MEQKKIVYEDLCCRIKGKAALIDYFAAEASDLFGRKLLEVAADERMEGFFEVNAVGNMAALSLVWDDEQKERVFDLMIRKNILNQAAEAQDSCMLLFQRPLLEWNQKEVRLDVVPFLVYALVRNERCKAALGKLEDDLAQRCYEAFARSNYGEISLFCWFLQEEKHLAEIAAGLCLLTRQAQDESDYRTLMTVLYKGYKPLKNVIKKWKHFCGKDIKKLYVDQNDLVSSMSCMIVQLVIAQDLGLPLRYDYEFYVILLSLCDFERKMMCLPSADLCTAEGKRLFRMMKKVYPDLDSCIACLYLDGGRQHDDEESRNKLRESAAAIVEDRGEENPMEGLFLHYGLHPRMFAAYQLQEDAEIMFSLFGEMDWEEYQDKILIAALCRYIQTLHLSCGEKAPEELNYRNRQAHKKIEEQTAEIKILSQKVAFLEQQELTYKGLLEQQELRREKLQDTVNHMSEKYAGEKEELIGLRNFVYQMSQESGKYQEIPNTNAILDEFKRERVAVIGGHEHWRSKMREIFPDGLFLAGNNNNFDASVLRNKRYIIFNTDILKHSSYYRIVKEKKKDQKILYVHGNNMERCLSELERQIADRQKV